MRKTKVRRLEVLEKIKHNYLKHKAEYAEAFGAYKEEVVRTAELKKEQFLGHLDDLLRSVKAAKLNVDRPVSAWVPSDCCNFNLTPPASHARDYEQAIMMLEMEVADEIELEADQFACYVMDTWDWKDEFESVSNYYKMSRNTNNS